MDLRSLLNTINLLEGITMADVQNAVGQETDEARKLHRYANSVPKDEYVFNRVALGESEEDASKAYDKLKSISEDEVASGMIPFALF